MAEAADHVSFARDNVHNPDALWKSTIKPLWNKKMTHIPFDSVTLDDLKADNSIMLMTTFCNKVAADPPISKKTKKPLTFGTLKSVLMTLIRKLTEKFARDLPENSPALFPEEEIIKWKGILKKGKSRTLMEGDKESELFKDCFPIPKEHSRRTNLFPAQDFLTAELRDQSRKTDLKSLSSFLFRRDRYSDLAKLLITFKAIGRGGEVKFLSYRRMHFDEYYNIMFTQWFQKKTLKSTPLGFVPEFDHPESCVFLALGCYWAVDNGLTRPPGHDTPGTGLDRKSAFVFQDLHDIKDDSVTKQLSQLIKSIVPDQLKSFYSVKSMRYGAMSGLMWDPAVAYEEAIALGGWSTTTNSDWYTWIYLIAVIPAVLSLNGYPDCRVLPYLPTCTRCFAVSLAPEKRMTADKYTAFVAELFPNSLRDFRFPHGRLRPLMNHVTSVMVMHFKYFYLKYGMSNEYVKRMVRACQACQLAENETQSISKLQLWSTVVKDDYKKGNTTGHDESADGSGNLLRRRRVKDELAKMNNNLATLLARQADSENQVLELTRATEKNTYEVEQLKAWKMRVAEQQETIIQQNEQIITLLQAAPAARRTAVNSISRLTPSPPSQVNQRPRGQPTLTLETPVRASPPRQPPTREAEPPAPPPNVNEALQRTAPLPKGKRGQRRKSTSLECMLNEWHRDPRMANFRSLQTGGPALEDQISWVHQQMFNAENKTLEKIRRSLMVLDCCWTAEERNQIIHKQLPMINAMRLHSAVVTRAINLVHVLKRPTPRTMKPNASASSNILGFGNSIMKIMKNLPEPLEHYIPNWREGGKIKAQESLESLANKKRQVIKAGATNTYNGARSVVRTSVAARRTTAASLTDTSGRASADGDAGTV